jgi:hypothetical protein
MPATVAAVAAVAAVALPLTHVLACALLADADGFSQAGVICMTALRPYPSAAIGDVGLCPLAPPPPLSMFSTCARSARTFACMHAVSAGSSAASVSCRCDDACFAHIVT